MKVLILGDGGREHALAWKLDKSPLVGQLYAAPGNAGISEIAECFPDVRTIEECANLAESIGIDLTIVGPETLLVDGVVDAFRKRGLRIFGPTQGAARLEGSKIWAKDVMLRAGIPTATWRSFTDRRRARAYARDVMKWQCVVKSDGLAAGKGSFVCRTSADVDSALDILLVEKRFASDVILIENLLSGQEVSVFAICDGRTVVPFGAAQDHKRAMDADAGPNTGGMGAYTPVDHMKLAKDFADAVFTPLIDELAATGDPYVGVLYAGAIVTSQGPKILEFNCRFGDPETEVLVRRLESDLMGLMVAAVDGDLHRIPAPQWNVEEALCVVMAAEPYPDGRSSGKPITGIRHAEQVEDVVVFHSGTALDAAGELVTAGGRILTVTGLGKDLETARSRAYEAVSRITFDGAYVRTDIGANALSSTWQTELRKPSRWQSRAADASRELGLIAEVLDAMAKGDDAPRGNVELDLRDRLHAVRLNINAALEHPRPEPVAGTEGPPEVTESLDRFFNDMQGDAQRSGFDRFLNKGPWLSARAAPESEPMEHRTDRS